MRLTASGNKQTLVWFVMGVRQTYSELDQLCASGQQGGPRNQARTQQVSDPFSVDDGVAFPLHRPLGHSVGVANRLVLPATINVAYVDS